MFCVSINRLGVFQAMININALHHSVNLYHLSAEKGAFKVGFWRLFEIKNFTYCYKNWWISFQTDSMQCSTQNLETFETARNFFFLFFSLTLFTPFNGNVLFFLLAQVSYCQNNKEGWICESLKGIVLIVLMPLDLLFD